MKYYKFTLLVSSSMLDIDDIENALYEAGCDDALLNYRNGSICVDFS